MWSSTSQDEVALTEGTFTGRIVDVRLTLEEVLGDFRRSGGTLKRMVAGVEELLGLVDPGERSDVLNQMAKWGERTSEGAQLVSSKLEAVAQEELSPELSARLSALSAINPALERVGDALVNMSWQLDAKGRQVPGDFLTAFLARDILARHAGAPVILDVKSSDMAMALIAAAGGDAQIWKTGHSHMKTRMAEINAPLAGEMSGHIFIKDGFYGFDDALYVGLRVLCQMAKTGQSITDFVDGLPPQHATPELRIDCPDDQKFGVIDRLATEAKARFGEESLSLIDGVRVRNDDGWWLVRASNTEAALVARAEGKTPEILDRLVGQIEDALAGAGLIWQRP